MNSSQDTDFTKETIHSITLVIPPLVEHWEFLVSIGCGNSGKNAIDGHWPNQDIFLFVSKSRNLGLFKTD